MGNVHKDPARTLPISKVYDAIIVLFEHMKLFVMLHWAVMMITVNISRSSSAQHNPVTNYLTA